MSTHSSRGNSRHYGRQVLPPPDQNEQNIVKALAGLITHKYVRKVVEEVTKDCQASQQLWVPPKDKTTSSTTPHYNHHTDDESDEDHDQERKPEPGPTSEYESELVSASSNIVDAALAKAQRMREMVSAYGKPPEPKPKPAGQSTSSKPPAPSKNVSSKSAPLKPAAGKSNLKRVPSTGKVTTAPTTKAPNKDTVPQPTKPLKPTVVEEPKTKPTTTSTTSTATTTHSTSGKTKSRREPEAPEEQAYKPKLGFPKEFVEEMARFRENRKFQAMYESRPTEKVFMDKINEYSARKPRKQPKPQGIGEIEAQLIAKRIDITKISNHLFEILQSPEWNRLVEDALNVNPREITPESAETLFRAWFTMESIKHSYADMKTVFEEASVHPVEIYTDNCLKYLLGENNTIPNPSPRNSNTNQSSSSSPTSKTKDDGIGSCSWINWWLPSQYSVGQDVPTMLTPKDVKLNDQGKKLFSYDSLTSLHELNELRHTVQLRLFHQHIQERVNSLLLPILTTLPVNDKRYISLFCLVHSLLCNDRCNGQELCAFLPAELGT